MGMNDRIAEIADRLTAKAMAGVALDGHEANALVDELTLGERKELMALVKQRLAHDEERNEAELEELDAMASMLELRKQVDRGEMSRREAERRLDEIDPDGGIWQRWQHVR